MNSSSTFFRSSSLYYLFTFIAFFATLGLLAQDGQAILDKLGEEDQESLKALVMYPEDTREHIFIAAQQPAALIRMKKVQERMSESFNEVISTKDKDTQKALWDLTRYPGLIDDLAGVGPNKESQAVKALQNHPEIIRVRALQMYDQQFPAIGKISSLKKESESAFDAIMQNYDPATQESLTALLEHPEVLGIMTESMDVTVTVGDMYRQDPNGTIALATKLNAEVADQNAKELNDWRTRLENDPEAMQEFEESTEEFLKEHEEDDVYYSEQEAELQDEVDPSGDEKDVQEVHHYHHYSYPYWFGYPRWFYYPRWRPYPWRYDWGWSFNVGWGGWRVWGMPSYYFMNWYYGYPFHYYNHPALACHFSAHYYGHRNSMSSVSTVTERWHRENASVLPSRLDANDPQSIKAVKELGQFETDRGVYNRNNPEAPVSKSEFLASKREQFPNLASSFEANRGSLDKANTAQPSKEASRTTSTVNKGDKVNVPGTDRSSTTNQPSRTGTDATKGRTTVPSRSKIDKATDQHRSGWEKQKSPSRVVPTPSRRTRSSTSGSSSKVRSSSPKPSTSPSRNSKSSGTKNSRRR